MKQYSLLLILFAAVGLSSCKNTAQPEAAAFDVAGMDTTIQPGDNFFKYANGKWLATTKIPDDQSGWGSFYRLYDNNLKKLPKNNGYWANGCVYHGYTFFGSYNSAHL